MCFEVALEGGPVSTIRTRVRLLSGMREQMPTQVFGRAKGLGALHARVLLPRRRQLRQIFARRKYKSLPKRERAEFVLEAPLIIFFLLAHRFFFFYMFVSGYD